MKQFSSLFLAASLAMACAAPVAAQSVFGCSDLDTGNGMPSLEGEGGTFYRINPDMRMFHAFSPETMDQLVALSTALADLGTTLIYVPLPTKSLAMPDLLPQTARDYGFDDALATSLYVDLMRRLKESGVQTADVRQALRVATSEPQSFFLTDYRMTAAGAARAAKVIAETIAATESFVALPKSRFESRPNGLAVLPSPMRDALQRHCMIELPKVEAETFTTARLRGGEAANDNTIFGGGSGGGRVALVGTEVDGELSANMAGFLAETTGLDVLQYSVSGGGSFAAISSYLSSPEFQDARPAYLVWTNPISNNLAQFGDQPMRELITAAGSTCRVPLSLFSGTEPNKVTADLSVLDRSQSYTLFVDGDGAQATEARFDFLAGSGLIQTKAVFRHPDQVKTGRFYMPMSGLWSEGAVSVDIVLDAPFGPSARVTACFD